MDRKSVAILIFSILGMVIWYKSINQMYPPKPTPQTVTENQEAPSVNPTLMETAGSPGEQEGNTSHCSGWRGSLCTDPGYGI